MYKQPRFSTSKFADQKELKDAMWDAEMMRKKDKIQINQERVVVKNILIPGPSAQIRNQIIAKVIKMRLQGMNISNRIASPSLRRNAEHINLSFEKVQQFLLFRN